VSFTGVVTVRPVNDPPEFIAVDGQPIEGGPQEFTVLQDDTMVINITWIDVEGDDLLVELNTTRVQFNESTGEITFAPTNEDVGTLRILVTVSEVNDSQERAELEIVIVTVNRNDPMDAPVIDEPLNGSRFLPNVTFWLRASCSDPDSIHGHVLNFTWFSNVSGELGTGSEVELMLPALGNHTITLVVDDGMHEMQVSIELTIYEEPEPPGPGPTVDDDAFPFMLIVILVVIAVLVAASVLYIRSRKVVVEAGTEGEEEEELEPPSAEEMMAEMAAIAGQAADELDEDEPSGR
jgi:hypothetical protein